MDRYLLLASFDAITMIIHKAKLFFVEIYLYERFGNSNIHLSMRLYGIVTTHEFDIGNIRQDED